MTLVAPVDEAPDEELIRRVRHGDQSALDALWRRHRLAAERMAAALTPDRAARDDIVQEAFLAVSSAISRGSGPTLAFRPYLVTTVRNMVIHNGHRMRKQIPVPEVPEAPTTDEDPVVEQADVTAALRAFEQLPERYQTVLWHGIVEDQKPSEFAPLLGVTPNTASQLLVRARNRLQGAFLQLQVDDAPVDDAATKCREVRRLLVAYVRDTLDPAVRDDVDAHLEECPSCRRAAAWADDAAQMMRRGVLPGLAGPAVADRYLLHAGHGGGHALGRILRRGRVRLGHASVGHVVAGTAVAGVVTAAAVTGSLLALTGSSTPAHGSRGAGTGHAATAVTGGAGGAGAGGAGGTGAGGGGDAGGSAGGDTSGHSGGMAATTGTTGSRPSATSGTGTAGSHSAVTSTVDQHPGVQGTSGGAGTSPTTNPQAAQTTTTLAPTLPSDPATTLPTAPGALTSGGGTPGPTATTPAPTTTTVPRTTTTTTTRPPTTTTVPPTTTTTVSPTTTTTRPPTTTTTTAPPGDHPCWPLPRFIWCLIGAPG